MATLFVCQGADDNPRWHEAFPDLQRLGPDAAERRVSPGDQAWVPTTLEAWPSRVKRLQASGAIVVVMSLAPSSQEALQALSHGARGYLHAFSPPALLREAALVTRHQGIWIPADLLAQVVGNTYRALGAEERLSEELLGILTERERGVALAVVQGLTNKEIARRLGITERTVKAHLGAIFRKLGVRDRMQLVLRLTHPQGVTPSTA